MRKYGVILFLAWAGLAFIGTQVNAQDLPWFDLEKCEMCKIMMEDPNLMAAMDWETHKVANGMVSVTICKDELLPAYREMLKKMSAMGEKLAQGEQHYLCGMCTAFGVLMMKGVKYEIIETKHGAVELMTSEKPELVAEIHALADRNEIEMAKWMETEKAKKVETKQ